MIITAESKLDIAVIFITHRTSSFRTEGSVMMTHKTVRTKFLEVAYEERGDPRGVPIILAHGFPDDVRTWDRVVATLADRGFRTLAPYTRGFGRTKFLDDEAFRTGQIAALTQDLMDFADALGIERFALVGHDWGARAAYGAAALWPERVRALVALSVGYGTSRPDERLSFEQARAYWYQWYFALERGREALERGRREFCRKLWRIWSPGFKFSDEEYDRTAESFENPDFVEVAIHSYRQRWGFVAGDLAYMDLEVKLKGMPPIRAPTILLHGADDGATLAETSAGRERFFMSKYVRRVLPDVGHFIQRERPEVVVEAVLELTSDLHKQA